MSVHLRVPLIPASFFGMVLGLSGLSSAWRLASQVWHLPAAVGETIGAFTVVVWAILVLLYGAKWMFARTEALNELSHPVQCCFVGLIGVATMLVGGIVLPYSYGVALAMFAVGAGWTLLFAVWRTGGLWFGERDQAMTTPVLYLPAVAGSFVMATAAAALGYPDWGQLVFGAGLFSWLAIESVLLHRLMTGPSLVNALRPTLGIQLAPAPVGAVAYISVSQGAPDLFAHALLGYGLLQFLVLLRLLPWIKQQPFAPSYWAFTFGATSLAIAPLRLIAGGDIGPMAQLAPILFLAANLIVGVVAIGTIWRTLQGRLVDRTFALRVGSAERTGAV